MSEVLKNTEITAYEPFKAQLATLEKENKNMVFDYDDKKSNKAARSHAHKLRQSKSAVEKIRVEQKAASLEAGRQIDSQARDIKEKFDSMIEVHAKPIRELEEKESARIEEIQTRLNLFVTLQDVDGLPSDRIHMRIQEAQRIDLDEVFFAEFLDKAGVAKDQMMTSLNASLAAALNSEEEAAELERLREESAEREQKDRDEKIRLEAEAKAVESGKQAAIKAKAESEAEAQKAKDAAEKRELQLRLDAETAKREAAEAIQKAKDDAAASAKLEQEAADKRAADKANRKRVITAAIDGFVSAGISKDVAEKSVSLIADGKIPNVSISF